MQHARDSGVRIDYSINDQANGYPTRTVQAAATDDEIAGLVQSGYLLRRKLIEPELAQIFADAVRRISEAEIKDPTAEYMPEENIYIRSLLEKDPVFHPLLRLEPALSVARSVLGPQVWVDLDARMNFPGREGVAVPWHIHMPVVPSPLPSFFCYPHQIHCLIYLDRVTELEGALCVLPGSHAASNLKIPLGDRSERDGQVQFFFEQGDAILIHGNLWHRTSPSKPSAGFRRLLLLGYVPSWIKGDTGRGVKTVHQLTADMARGADNELRELLGEFEW